MPQPPRLNRIIIQIIIEKIVGAFKHYLCVISTANIKKIFLLQ